MLTCQYNIRRCLQRIGVSAGPITETTRAIYLRRQLESSSCTLLEVDINTKYLSRVHISRNTPLIHCVMACLLWPERSALLF